MRICLPLIVQHDTTAPRAQLFPHYFYKQGNAPCFLFLFRRIEISPGLSTVSAPNNHPRPRPALVPGRFIYDDNVKELFPPPLNRERPFFQKVADNKTESRTDGVCVESATLMASLDRPSRLSMPSLHWYHVSQAKPCTVAPHPEQRKYNPRNTRL